MPFSEADLVSLLGRIPPSDDPPEAARNEAATVVKRGLNLEKDDAGAALRTYRDALELDPTCKPAYEAIGRIVLAQPNAGEPLHEAALRYFELAQKRLPGDAAIADLVKKLRAIVSPGAAIEPALARPARAARPMVPVTPSPSASNRGSGGGGGGRNCQYCGSPIPIGSSDCKSCQMSGEILKSDVRAAIREKQKSSSALLFVLFVLAVLVVGALGITIYVRLHK